MTEAVFRAMAYKSISQEQAELIVNRLLREPLWNSASSAELVAAVEANDDMAADLLIRHAPDLMPSLSTEDRHRLLHALERLIDKTELREARRATEAADLHASLHELRAATAQAGEARARLAGQAAAAAAAKAEVDSIVERRVAERLTAASSAGATAAVAVAAPGTPSIAAAITEAPEVVRVFSRQTRGEAPQDDLDGPPLLSERVDRFFMAKRYPAHTEHQSRATIRM